MGVSRGTAESACLHKRHYTSRAKAVRAARATQSVLGKRMDWYRCLHCRLWHLGTAR